MKKVIVLLSMIFLILLVVPSVLALELEVEKLSANEVVISGLNEPASFDLRITNLGSSENVVLYSFFTQEISPKELRLEGKKSQDVTLKIYPSERMKPDIIHLIILLEIIMEMKFPNFNY